jgi:Methyltransferase domain
VSAAPGIDWYDEALYYDVLFDWDPARERDFVLGASRAYGVADPTRLLEPMCGTGRLLRALPGATGFDLSRAMVRFASGRGLPVFQADAARFAVRPESFQLAYCLIDSFRHLLDEPSAAGHLRAVAQALAPGAVYVLGFDVTGGLEEGLSAEEWSMERGPVRVRGRVEGIGDADPTRRLETMRVTLDVRDSGRRRRLESRQPLRTYTHAQVRALIATDGLWELAAAFDRRYDLGEPRSLESIDGSAVLVLRKHGSG